MAINWDLSCFKPVFSMVLYLFDWGQKAVRGAANGIAWGVQSAHAGTGFAFASLTNVKMMDMAVAAHSQYY